MPRTAAGRARWGENYFEDPTRFTQRGTEQRALERGQVIEPSTPRLLQIDIDGPEAYERFEMLLEMWEGCPTLPRLGTIVERDSRTPGNKHITIELDTDFSVSDRILFQALLGSDLKRELLSLASLRNGHENPIVLYRTENSDAASPRPGDGTDSAGCLDSADDPFAF